MTSFLHSPRARLALAVVVSLLLHVGILLALRPLAPSVQEQTVVTTLVEPEPPDAIDEPVEPVERAAEPSVADGPRSEETRVAAVFEPERPDTEPPPEAPPPEPQPEVEEDAPEEADAEPEPPPEEREELRSVAQPDRNAEAPDQAEFLAEFDNSTDVQTMAEDVVLQAESSDPSQASAEEEAEAEDDPGASEEVLSQSSDVSETEDTLERAPEAGAEAQGTPLGVADGSDAPAEPAGETVLEQEAVAATAEADAAVDPAHRVDDLPGAEAGVQQPPSAIELLSPQRAIAQAARDAQSGGSGVITRGDAHGIDSAAYLEVLGERDAAERAEVAAEARASSLVGDHAQRWERTRAALENFDVHVQPGTETSLNTRSDEVAGYIHYLHNKIHEPWWEFLTRSDLSFGPGHPLSDLSLVAVMEFGIDREGEVDTVRIVDGSGVLAFDAYAVDLLYEIGPHRPPPPGMISSDGNAYVRWTMHRDNRGCGTFGASGHRVQMGAGEGG